MRTVLFKTIAIIAMAATAVLAQDPTQCLVAALRTSGVAAASICLPGTACYNDTTNIQNARLSFIRPLVAVEPRNDNDVVASIAAAKACGTPYSTVSGGHSGAGYGLVDKGLTVNMRSMAEISFTDDTMTVSSGTRFGDAYAAVIKYNSKYCFIGGGCLTVAPGGYTQGGGYSFISRMYGLAIDNLLSARMILADGTRVEVSEKNPQGDLWWGLRGNGGGNLGVVTSYTYKLIQPPSDSTVGVMCWHPEDWNAIRPMFGWWTSNYYGLPQWINFEPVWLPRNATPSAPATLKFCWQIFCMNSPDQCNPSINYLRSFNPLFEELAVQPFCPWAASLGSHTAATNADNLYLKSWIFTHGRFTMDIAEIVFWAVDTMPKGPGFDNLVLFHEGGGAIEQVPNNATAFAWRDFQVVIQLKAIWRYPGQEARAMQWIEAVAAQFDAKAQGAFLNYIDPYLVGWQQKYYRNHYNRLVELKASVDPQNFFRFNQSLGSSYLTPAKNLVKVNDAAAKEVDQCEGGHFCAVEDVTALYKYKPMNQKARMLKKAERKHASRVESERYLQEKGYVTDFRAPNFCRRNNPACWPTDDQAQAFREEFEQLSQGPMEMQWAGPASGEPQPQAVPQESFGYQPLYGLGAYGKKVKPVYTVSGAEAGRACFKGDPSPFGASDTCNAAVRNNEFFGWTPYLIVFPVNEQQITLALQFAVNHNLSIAVVNTGHDYSNRHSAPDGMMIRVGFMQNRNFTEYDSRFPEATAGTFTFGPGNTFSTLHWYADQVGRELPSGWCSTVGITGWNLGGGYGPLSGTMGMGADNTLEFELLQIKNGQVVKTIASKYENPDLLKAMKGGGGSVWGVVLSIKTKAHMPPPAITVFNITTMGNFCDQFPVSDTYGRAALKSMIQQLGLFFLNLTNKFATQQLSSLNGYAPFGQFTQYEYLQHHYSDPCQMTWGFNTLMWYQGYKTDADYIYQRDLLTKIYSNGGNKPSDMTFTYEEQYATAYNYLKTEPAENWWIRPQLQDTPTAQDPGALPEALVMRDTIQRGAWAEEYFKEILNCAVPGQFGGSPGAPGNEGDCNIISVIYCSLTGNLGAQQPDGTVLSPGFRYGMLNHLAYNYSYQKELASIYSLSDWTYWIESSFWMLNWPSRFWTADAYNFLVSTKNRFDPDNRFWCHFCIGDDPLSPEGYHPLSGPLKLTKTTNFVKRQRKAVRDDPAATSRQVLTQLFTALFRGDFGTMATLMADNFVFSQSSSLGCTGPLNKYAALEFFQTTHQMTDVEIAPIEAFSAAPGTFVDPTGGASFAGTLSAIAGYKVFARAHTMTWALDANTFFTGELDRNGNIASLNISLPFSSALNQQMEARALAYEVTMTKGTLAETLALFTDDAVITLRGQAYANANSWHYAQKTKAQYGAGMCPVYKYRANATYRMNTVASGCGKTSTFSSEVFEKYDFLPAPTSPKRNWFVAYGSHVFYFNEALMITRMDIIQDEVVTPTTGPVQECP